MMSLLGSAAGRALAGAAGSVYGLANRYIDEELKTKRDQALADIQFNLAQRTEEYMQGDEVQSRRRANERSRLDMEAESKLTAARNEANDQTLQGAKARNAGAMAGEETTARGEAEAGITKKFGNDPLFIAAKRKMHVDSADNIARAELARMEIADRKTLTTKYDELATIELDDTLTPEQKAAKAKPIITVIQAIKSKNSPGEKGEKGARQTVEEEFGPDGKPISRKVKTEGPAPTPQPASEDVIRGQLAKARKDGKLSEAIAELPSDFRDRKALKSFGVTDEEIAATKPVAETVNDNTIGLGEDYRTPEFKGRLQARIVEAQRGGRPLNRTERLRAKQLGLVD